MVTTVAAEAVFGSLFSSYSFAAADAAEIRTAATAADAVAGAAKDFLYILP